jgi:hypothetical protein
MLNLYSWGILYYLTTANHNVAKLTILGDTEARSGKKSKSSMTLIRTSSMLATGPDEGVETAVAVVTGAVGVAANCRQSGHQQFHQKQEP